MSQDFLGSDWCFVLVFNLRFSFSTNPGHHADFPAQHADNE